MNDNNPSLTIGVLAIVAAFLLNSSFLLPDAGATNIFKIVNYRIAHSSSLEIAGKTNIHSFFCNSLEKFSEQKLKYKFSAESPSISFEDTALKIKIEDIDCGSKRLNKDLHKALRLEEYPHIIIDLKRAFSSHLSDLKHCGEWFELNAETDITITCETHLISIPIWVNRSDTDSFRITGSTSLQLCDFGIEPPTVLMGMIKVENTIDIHFDLNVLLIT